MHKQLLHPRDLGPAESVSLSMLGRDHPEGIYLRDGRNWRRHQACHQDTFLLNTLESYATRQSVGYTRQEDFIKINFWLSGRHTTILDGFGQHEHERPEVFVTAGPPEMTKVDLCDRNNQVASVALCVRQNFFPVHMGLAADDLPQPLQGIVLPETIPYAFHRYSLTPDMMAAARAILAAPAAVRREPIYLQAKAVELMFLLINRMADETRETVAGTEVRSRNESRLHEARAFLMRHYAEDITLERISREVGLNKMALTSGFRRLFGMSVYDCLQKVRMERAYELLQDRAHTIAQIAQAIGYAHHCNFSTAFQAYYGCTPQKARREPAPFPATPTAPRN